MFNMITRYLAVQVALLSLAAPAAADSALRGYGTLHGQLGLQTWGGATVQALKDDPRYSGLAEPSLSTGGTGGLYLSGHYIFRDKRLHLGGFLSYQAGEMQLYADSNQTLTNPLGDRLTDARTVHDVAIGLTAKTAAAISERFWLGGAVDLGPCFLTSDGEHLATGFFLFPRFTADFLLWTLHERYQVGISASLGLVIEASIAGELDLVTPGTTTPITSDFDYTFVRPMLMVGGTFGL